ncbi:MAG: hypothetical protein ABSB59_14460 [Streptosporangiaceae bacterium]
MFVNTIGAGLELVVIVILRHQAVRPGLIGLALGVGAAGGLAAVQLAAVLYGSTRRELWRARWPR